MLDQAGLDAKLSDEPARLAALDRYQVLDTAEEGPFDKITALVRTILGVPISAVSLIDADRQWFKSRQGLDVRETPREWSFCTHAILDRSPLIIRDTAHDARFRENPLVLGPPHIRSYAGAPLRSPDGYNIGSLCAIDVVPRDFDAGDIAILAQLADLAIDSLELRRVAECDSLTGALSRRALIAEMDREMERYVRYGRSSALVLFDIDHFKAVNDAHGHGCGDEVLKKVAACCQARMRPNDSFGRVGGEEFAFVLPETTAQEALLAAERFRVSIEALTIEAAGPLHVAASFGIAALDDDCLGSQRWMARADKGLYAAKRSGRNRCCIGQAD